MMNQTTQRPPKVTNTDLPLLFNAADQASLSGQQTYLQLYKADLVSLVVGALLVAVNTQNSTLMRGSRVAGASLLALSLVLTCIISIKRYKQRWYGGRAAAESIKSLSWRYMMGSQPFVLSLSERDADHHFTGNLEAILSQSDQLTISLGKPGGQITERMRRLRSLTLEERKQVYLDDRIGSQQVWYSSKAQTNEALETRYFLLAFGTQALALVYAILLAARPSIPLDLTGVFATAAAALFAWMQVKQYQELAQAYAVAAHELGLIYDQARYITSDEEFSVFVANAEAAISREHTLWIARRDKLPRASTDQAV